MDESLIISDDTDRFQTNIQTKDFCEIKNDTYFTQLIQTKIKKKRSIKKPHPLICPQNILSLHKKMSSFNLYVNCGNNF